MSVDARAQINIALQLHQSGNLLEAEKLYTEILAEYPDECNALNLLGFLKIQNNQFNDAILHLQRALSKYPYFFDAWFNLGLAYKNNNQFDDAIIAYEKALSIEPDNAFVYFNLANIFESRNDTFKAIEYYEKAYEYSKDKNDSDIHFFLGICYLKAKNFEKGLFHHEYRPSKHFATHCQALIYKEQMETKPLWMGEPITDKTLFVYYESALGDTLMYTRYLALIKDKCAKVLFKPQLCFVDFFKENNFGAEIIESKTLPENVVFDAHIPLMSIPFVLNLNTEEIPLSEGYLKANIEKVKSYKEKYFNNNKFKIGIKWQGNMAYDWTRIIKFESFYKIFDLPGTQFYSVQKGEGIEELEKLPDKYNIIDLGITFNDFRDTAAALENLDLVICNDTSVAHLAGAMGKPCWILLPFVQNWRWHTDISYSPWYKSVKLFKQNEPDNWDEVLDRVYAELNNLI